MAKIGSVVVSLDVDIGRMSRFADAARMVDTNTARMRRGLASTTASVSSLRTHMSTPMRANMFGEALRTITRTNDEIQRLRASMVALSAITGTGLTAALSGAYLLQTADRAKLLGNQLRTVTKDHADLANIQERLFDIAQRTRTSLDSTTRIYARTARATEFFAVSQEKLLRVTETIQKAFAIGGATQAEAFGAAIQLSQGIASDRFSGEEFRSVAENAPVLLQNMAKSLGVNIGKLREMAHAGELTGQVVVDAILRSSKAIDGMFETADVTVGQAFTRLDNAFIQYIGNVDQSYGVTRRLASGLSSLAENFDSVASAAGYAAIGLAATFFANRFGKFSTAAYKDMMEASESRRLAHKTAVRDLLEAERAEKNLTQAIQKQQRAVVNSRMNLEQANVMERRRIELLGEHRRELAKLQELENRAVAAGVNANAAARIDKEFAQRLREAERLQKSGLGAGDSLVAASMSANSQYMKSAKALVAEKEKLVKLETDHAEKARDVAAKIAMQTDEIDRAARIAMESSDISSKEARKRERDLKRLIADTDKLRVTQETMNARHVEQADAINQKIRAREALVVSAALRERELLNQAMRHADTIADQAERTRTLNALKERSAAISETMVATQKSIDAQLAAQQRRVAAIATEMKNVTLTEAQRLKAQEKYQRSLTQLYALQSQKTGLAEQIQKSNAALQQARYNATALATVLSGMRTVGAGLLSVIGGWQGALLLAAFGGMTYFMQRSALAAEETRTITKQLENMGYLAAEAADEMGRFQQSVAEGRVSKLLTEVQGFRREIEKAKEVIGDLSIDFVDPRRDQVQSNYFGEGAERLKARLKEFGDMRNEFRTMQEEIQRTGEFSDEMRRRLENMALANPEIASVTLEFIRMGELINASGKAVADWLAEVQKARVDTPAWVNDAMFIQEAAEKTEKTLKEQAAALDEIATRRAEAVAEETRRLSLSKEEQETLKITDDILKEMGKDHENILGTTKQIAESRAAAIQAAIEERDAVRAVAEEQQRIVQAARDSVDTFGKAGSMGDFAKNASDALQKYVGLLEETNKILGFLDDAHKMVGEQGRYALEIIGEQVGTNNVKYETASELVNAYIRDLEAQALSEEQALSRLKEMHAAFLQMGMAESVVNRLIGAFANLASSIFGAVRAQEQLTQAIEGTNLVKTTYNTPGGQVTVTRPNSSGTSNGGGTTDGGSSSGGGLVDEQGLPYTVQGGVRVPAWSDGGYTGDGGKYEPAGVAHKGEYIFTKEETAAIGVSTLRALAKNAGRGYSTGGYVGTSTATVLPGGDALARIEMNTSELCDKMERSIQYLSTISTDIVTLGNRITRAMTVSASSSYSSGSSSSSSGQSSGQSSGGGYGVLDYDKVVTFPGVSGVPISVYYKNGREVSRSSFAGKYSGWGSAGSFADGGVIGGKFAGGGSMRGDKQMTQFFKNPEEAVYVLTGAQQEAFRKMGEGVNNGAKGDNRPPQITLGPNYFPVTEPANPASRQALMDDLARTITAAMSSKNG